MALFNAANNIIFPRFSATPKSVRSESNESRFCATPKKIGLRVVLGRVKDSSSHDSILFGFFAGEREDSSLCQGLAGRGPARVILGEW
jgi:hypothetical protein